MQKTKLQERWSGIDMKTIARSLRSTSEATAELSPFGTHQGRIDLRGFTMPPPLAVEGRHLAAIDLSAADLSGVRFERCHLEDVLFDGAVLDGLRDFGNRFERCSFVRTSFVGAQFGYDGSQYHDCLFERCSFRRAGATRTEFYGCRFKDCRLKGIDFAASAFEDCTFEGKVEDVWFRGGYGFSGDERRYGIPKRNQMLNVSFAKAELSSLTISDDCDLSTVILPEHGIYRKYDRWPQRLMRLQAEADKWPEPERSEGRLFVDVYFRFPEQRWMIVGLDDVRNHLCPHAADRIMKVLDHAM